MGTTSKSDSVRDVSSWWSLLTLKDVERIRKAYTIPNNMTIRIPSPNSEIEVSDRENEVCILKAMFKLGIKLLLLAVVRELLHYLRLSLIHINPNVWRYLLACSVLWPMVLGEGTH